MSDITERVERGAALLDEDAGPHSCQCVNLLLGVNFVCGEPAVGPFRRACVHEHIRDSWICQDHVDAPEMGLCLTCFELDGDLAHECPIALTPLAGKPAQP